MTDSKEENRLGIALLNGIVLGLIGLFLLATPSSGVDLTPEEARLDYIAGTILIVFSAIMFTISFVRRSRN